MTNLSSLCRWWREGTNYLIYFWVLLQGLMNSTLEFPISVLSVADSETSSSDGNLFFYEIKNKRSESICLPQLELFRGLLYVSVYFSGQSTCRRPYYYYYYLHSLPIYITSSETLCALLYRMSYTLCTLSSWYKLFWDPSHFSFPY